MVMMVKWAERSSEGCRVYRKERKKKMKVLFCESLDMCKLYIIDL